MPPSHPPTFIVIYGGVHSSRKDRLKKSEFKIQSPESLNLIAEPLQICYAKKRKRASLAENKKAGT